MALGHQGTKAMVADGLTKLATAEVMKNLRKAMAGELSPITVDVETKSKKKV